MRRLLESERVWLWSIIAIGGILRFYRLDYQSLWVDEGLQYYVASTNSLPALFDQLRSFHPPLSFIVNHAFLQLGKSEFLLRLPSALLGTASLPLFYVLVRDLTSSRVALVSTSALALTPFHIWYSQEGRMYAQLLFFSLLSTVALLQALRYREARWWVAYVLVATAGMFTQVFMVLALVAQFFWVFCCHRKAIIPHLISGAAVFMLFLPWVLLLPWVQRFFLRVAQQGLATGSPVNARAAARAGFSFEAIPYTFFSYSSGFSLGPTVAELHENRSLGFIMQFAVEIISVGLIFGFLLVIGVWSLYKRFGGRVTVLCGLSLCLPLAGALLYALAPRATYNVRYSIVAFPYFCILLGAGLTFLWEKSRPVGLAFGLGIASVTSISLANHYFNPRYAKEDVRGAVAFWRSNSPSTPLLTFKAHHVLSLYLTEAEKERHSRLTGKVVSDIQTFLSRTDSPYVYVLFTRDWSNLQEKATKNAFRVDFEKSFPGVTLIRISNSQGANHSGDVSYRAQDAASPISCYQNAA